MVKHVFRYLKGTRDLGITFQQNSDLNLKLYVDVDYANQADTLSIGGYVATFGGGSVAWSSKKQRTVVLSTTEVEYITLMGGTKQLIWLWNF